ncbi:hypothetical protein ACT027_33440, partial [Pseudomonas aeruginosa]
PVRMSVEQVSGSAWAECPNGVESAPAIVRLKKVNLNDWYLANTREVQKPKRARKSKPAKAAPKAKTPVRKELKLGSLDQLIAPVDPLTC